MPSNTSLSDRLPAHHPLKALQTIAGEAISALLPSIEASCAEADLPALSIGTVLKASLLQALYSINDPNQFIEHLRFNVLFRWFMGNLSRQEQITSATDYVQFQAKLLDNHSLSHFLEYVIRHAANDESPNAAYIASNLSRWMNKHCPKEVFFKEYRHAPIIKMSCTILFPPERHPNIPEAVFYEYAKGDFPECGTRKETVASELRSTFSSRGRNEPVFWSSSRQYFVTLHNASAVSLTKLAPYDNWESFSNKFERLIKHCKSANSLANPLGVICAFSNLIRLSADLDLSDYFHVAPSEPPLIQIPQIMQESGRNYEFPRILESTRNLSKLRYNNDPALLLYCFQAQRKQEEIEIMLDLECMWTKPLEMDEVSSITNKLKENAYIAFHSLITDKARRLFE